MSSLRGTLAGGLLAVGALLVLLSLGASYLLANQLLVRQFDRGLLERATSLATLLEQVGERVELHFADELMPRYSARERPEYFQVWIGARVLERSLSLHAHPGASAELSLPLGARAGTTFFDLDLPDGRAGRAVALSGPVHHYAPDPTGADPGPARALVVVAIERADLEQAIRHLLFGVVGLGLVLVVVLLYLGTKVLTLALRPLQRLADELSRVEAQAGSAAALAFPGLPREIEPVVARVRSLTSSLQEALERERRTTASIAHELRTPIAELRAITEVALQTPDDAQAFAQALEECRGIALDMQALVTTLLALARSRAAQAALIRAPVDLDELVQRLWTSYAARAAERGLEWTLRRAAIVPPVLASDEILRSVLSNLFDNACSHSPPGSRAECRLEADGTRVSVSVSNPAPGIGVSDLARFGEPFWRADSARSERDHFGLGLALARECAAAGALELTFRLEDGELLATVAVPRA